VTNTNAAVFITFALGSGRMVADSEITISTTKHMARTDAAPFLSYLGRLVSINAHASVYFVTHLVGITDRMEFLVTVPGSLRMPTSSRNRHQVVRLDTTCVHRVGPAPMCQGAHRSKA